MSKKRVARAQPTNEITFVPVANLTKYARNARTHSPEQIESLAKSIREFGWTSPELADEHGGLIAGHGRVMAAERLHAEGVELRMASGLPIPAGSVPVLFAHGWTEAQKRAYVLADNKLALQSGWDQDLLKIELAELKGGEFDLGLTGFTLPEIELTLSGWDMGADPRDKDGSHLNGISVTVKFHVAKGDAATARKVCIAALAAAGVAYEE